MAGGSVVMYLWLCVCDVVILEINILSILTDILKLLVRDEIIFFWLSVKSMQRWARALLILSSFCLFSYLRQTSLRASIASLISFFQLLQLIS